MYTLRYEEWNYHLDTWEQKSHDFDDFEDMLEAAQELRCSMNIRNIT